MSSNKHTLSINFVVGNIFQERDALLDQLRRAVAQLTRLRHPQVLTVQHPLEESRDSLAFATEPVYASLANVLGRHDNLPSPVPTHLRDYKVIIQAIGTVVAESHNFNILSFRFSVLLL